MKRILLVITCALLLSTSGYAKNPKKSEARYKRSSSVPAAGHAAGNAAVSRGKVSKQTSLAQPSLAANDVIMFMGRARPIRNSQICLLLELIWLTDEDMAEKLKLESPRQRSGCKGV